MQIPKAHTDAALRQIATLTEPERLRKLIANAERLDQPQVAVAAFRRLCEILPEERPGTVTFAIWRSIFALEEMLTVEREKTTRLSRTRQLIAKKGEIAAVSQLCMKSTASEGFHMLVERGCHDLLFEYVVLTHQGDFTEEVGRAAASRLAGHGLFPELTATLLSGQAQVSPL